MTATVSLETKVSSGAENQRLYQFWWWISLKICENSGRKGLQRNNSSLLMRSKEEIAGQNEGDYISAPQTRTQVTVITEASNDFLGTG